MKKYEILQDQSLQHKGVTVYRIRALIDFGAVKAGQLGGHIAGEANLSHEGTCWVADDAVVSGHAAVEDDAWVTDKAVITGNARVGGNARVNGKAFVGGRATIIEQARVAGRSRVVGYAHVEGKTQIFGSADVSNSAVILGGAIYGDSIVGGNAVVEGGVIYSASVGGNAVIKPGADINSGARISNDAVISKRHDVHVVSNVGSETGVLTIYRTASGYKVNRGCYNGTVKEFLDAVAETHDDNIHGRFYKAQVELIINYMKERDLEDEV